MKQLTKADDEVMQVVCQLEKANVAALRQELSEPKPAYNTVSTISWSLEDKGFVRVVRIEVPYITCQDQDLRYRMRRA